MTQLRDQEQPAIFEGNVIWQDSRSGNWDIYGLNLYSLDVEPLDTDNDGVIDDLDGCYNPDCDIIDSQGCPKDSDGDGLNDCEDNCPAEFGVRDNSGCPSGDTDNDGVIDDLDANNQKIGLLVRIRDYLEIKGYIYSSFSKKPLIVV